MNKQARTRVTRRLLLALASVFLAAVPLAGCLDLAGDDAAENEAPNADLTATKDEAWTGERITFDAGESSDPDGEIQRYRFDFGDGTVEEQPEGGGVADDEDAEAEHTYLRGGSYLVTVTVFDDGGERAGAKTDTASYEVDINEEIAVPPQAIFAGPIDQTGHYQQPFDVYEESRMIELNLTLRSTLAVGSSEIDVRILDPNNDTLEEETYTVDSTQDESVDLTAIPTEAGAHRLVVEANNGGIQFEGTIEVFYGEEAAAEEATGQDDRDGVLLEMPHY